MSRLWIAPAVVEPRKANSLLATRPSRPFILSGPSRVRRQAPDIRVHFLGHLAKDLAGATIVRGHRKTPVGFKPRPHVGDRFGPVLIVWHHDVRRRVRSS